MSLDPREIRRYARQMVMPELGREGQERLKEASVLVIGAGGLGTPAATYLAAAGVGRLGIVEFDRVEESNLHRQVLYGEADVGRPKLDVAVERLARVNPHVELERIDARLGVDNARELVGRFDVVIDGSDNFRTRYLANDACVLAGRPNVFGSVLRFEGRLSVFATPEGPCYRCLFPEPPPRGLVPSCAEGGVLGVLPGVIGGLQAQEAIKLLLGVGEPLVGRVLVLDGMAMRFREIAVPKSPDCAICSENPTRTELVDDGEGDECATEEPVERTDRDVPFDITPRELEQRLSVGEGLRIVDVRTPMEFSIARIEGSILLPLNELPQRYEELDRNAEIAVLCHHGPRSAQAVTFLRQRGFAKARNVVGGIDAWSRKVDAGVPKY